MLPVSGAEQLKASGAIVERPMISHSGAYSRLVSPAPRSLSGRKRFQTALPRLRLELFDDGRNLPACGPGVELVVEGLLARVDVLVHEVGQLFHVLLGALRILKFHVWPPRAHPTGDECSRLTLGRKPSVVN